MHYLSYKIDTYSGTEHDLPLTQKIIYQNKREEINKGTPYIQITLNDMEV